MSLASLALLAAGFALLTGGAELLVRGASSLASRLGIPPLVVGLTVVAFGTSSPEVAVSVQAAMGGQPQVALGNVVGSNIFNVLFILGISALVAPLVVQRQLVRLDVPVMIVVSILPPLLAMDGALTRRDGTLLLVLGATYTGLLAYLGLQGNDPTPAAPAGEIAPDPAGRPRGWLRELALVLGGLLLLSLGADWLVVAAARVARNFGVSELVIGLTLISAGTSLPEVATSVVASFRGERDIAVGNVVGSNIFNVLAVLGVAAFAAPGGIAVPPGVLTFDFPVMAAVALACLPIFFTGWQISRWEGAVFVLYYLIYLVYLLLHSSGHEADEAFGAVIVLFVFPLTAVTAAVIWYQDRKGGA